MNTSGGCTQLRPSSILSLQARTHNTIQGKNVEHRHKQAKFLFMCLFDVSGVAGGCAWVGQAVGCVRLGSGFGPARAGGDPH